MLSKKTLLFLYVFIALIYFWADSNAMLWLTYLTKPALVSILLVYFYLSAEKPLNSFFKAIFIGLVFSIAGDSFLLFDGDLFFMLGLGSFLLTHVFYAKAFLSAVPSSLSHFFASRKIPMVLFLVLLISLMTYLWPDLGGLRWPVLVYGTAIVIMGLTAFNLKGIVAEKVFVLLFFGAMIFMFSDTIIALDKFKSAQLNLPFPRLLIMVPYLLSQYMIVEGSIKRINP